MHFDKGDPIPPDPGKLPGKEPTRVADFRKLPAIIRKMRVEKFGAETEAPFFVQIAH